MSFLSLDVPVIQGGMGVGVSLGGLAGAVAKEGAAGTISTAQIGFREPDFEHNPQEANLRAMGKEIEKARKIAGGKGAIGVNIMTVTQNYDAYVEEAVKQKVDFIVSGAGLPMNLPSLVKGSNVKIIPIVSSKRAAAVICKRWLKRENRLPDAVIIEGPKAGGHLGFSTDEIVKYTHCDIKYDEEITNIINYIRELGAEHNLHIPVFVAGGYRTKQDLEHALSLGADGIQLATPFVTTKECDADLAFKMAYVNAKKEDICIVKSPVGMPGRAVRNAFVEKTVNDRIPVQKCYKCISVCNPAETPYCITQALIRAVTGDIENGLVFCGADAWKEDRIREVKDVIEKFK